MVIPRVYDTFYNKVRLEDGSQTCRERTPDVFLLWGSLIWAGSFLYVNYQFLLGLVFVNWAGGIMYLVTTINVEARTFSVRPAATMSTGLQSICH
jgi:hypothetical protein